MIWNAVERFGSSFFLFVSNLVLARLLSPDDFGCIGMLSVSYTHLRAHET